MKLSCKLCKSTKFSLLKEIGNYDIYLCNNCDLGLTVLINSDLKNHKEKIKSELYSFKNYDLVRFKYIKRFNYLIKIIKKFKKKGSVLEVGAGFGLFSMLLSKENSYEIEVIEPFNKSQYIFKDKNIIINRLTLEKYLTQVKNKKFDIIVLFDVLEHLNEPSIILEKLNKILNKNGIVIIQLPNHNSLMAKVCKSWSWWLPEEHKYHFSPKSMNLLLKKKGLMTKYFTTYEDFNDFKKNLDGNFTWIKNNLIRKINKAFFYFYFIPLYFLLRKLIWSQGYGGLIFLIARSSK